MKPPSQLPIATSILVTHAQRTRISYVCVIEVACVLLLTALSGCGPTPDVYKGFVGENQPVQDVAVIRAETAAMYKIDGMEMRHSDPGKAYREAYVSPGEHTILIFRRFWVSSLIVAKGYIDAVSKPLTVDLKAGHVYELHGDRTTGNIRMTLWIEESGTGVVVARDDNPQEWSPTGARTRKTNAEIIEENRIKLEQQCKAQPERC